MKENAITYKIANTAADFEESKNLFEEYALTLNIDLSFQNFENELKYINVKYNKPGGILLLAQIEAHSIGCAGVRKLDDETAELKRMYVRNEFRGRHIGVQLLERSLILAKELGYKKIRLDSLVNMTKAQELYRSFGFYQIPAYYNNPTVGVVYMEKVL